MNDFHRQAMDLAARGFLAQMGDNPNYAISLFEQALELELEAIAELEEPIEPTHGVLHRSAGWMALHSRQYRRAEQLACSALAKTPPEDIAEELRILLEQVNFHRHYANEGIELGDGEIQLSLLGRAVADGITQLSDLVTRANHTQALVYRIAQWKLDLPYRGRIPTDIRNRYRAFMCTPKSQGFAISLRLGHPVFQSSLPHFVGAGDIVREFTDFMELVSGPNTDEISQHVGNPAYRRNLVGLAKSLAPDGTRISRVGFTTVSRGDTRSVLVTKPPSEFPPLDAGTSVFTDSEMVERSGTLRYADASSGAANHNRIRLINDDGSSCQVIVPSGLMDDIVRPMWNLHVTVRGTVRGRQRHIRLREIWESEPRSNRQIGEVLSAAESGGGLQYSLFQPVC